MVRGSNYKKNRVHRVLAQKKFKSLRFPHSFKTLDLREKAARELPRPKILCGVLAPLFGELKMELWLLFVSMSTLNLCTPYIPFLNAKRDTTTVEQNWIVLVRRLSHQNTGPTYLRFDRGPVHKSERSSSQNAAPFQIFRSQKFICRQI